MIRVNISELLSYQTCPSLWASRWVFGREGVGLRSGALDVGSAFHKVVAEALGEEANEKSYFAGRICRTLQTNWDSRGIVPDTEALRDAAHLEIWLSRLWEDRPWSRILGTEVYIERPISDDVILFGRLDGVAEVRGGLRVLEWKTTAASTNMPSYAIILQRSLQLAGYTFLGQGTYGDSFVGALAMIVKKLSHHTRQAGVTCEDCGEKGYQSGRPIEAAVLWSDMVIGEKKIERAVREIASLARQMAAERARLLSVGTRISPLPILQHTRECGGKFGNSLCQYMPVCDGETSIDDNVVFQNADPLASYRTEVEA